MVVVSPWPRVGEQKWLEMMETDGDATCTRLLLWRRKCVYVKEKEGEGMLKREV